MATSNAATMEPISAKLRRDEKATFTQVCDSIGTTPSNAIRMFVSAFNKRGGFPFDPSNPYGFNAETLAAMSDAANGVNLSGPYATVDEAFEALDED
jgi:DNA-damage-inducible protein J